MDNRDNGEVTSWTIHPAASHPVKTAAALFIISMIIGAIYQITREWIYCVVALGVFMVTLAPYFHKTVYRIDDSGVLRRQLGTKRFLSWSTIQSYTLCSRGIYLSTKRYGNWRDFRGIYVIFGREKEAIIARVKEEMGKDKGIPVRCISS